MAIQAALKFWQDFNIQDFQHELDVLAQEVAKRQDSSDENRKKLVDLSREFKKTSTEEVRKKAAPLLKSFQGEVDALSRRSQAAESAFLTTYKRLIDIPDPIPVLDQAVTQQQKLMQSQDHEIEVKQLRETLQEYNSEFAHVKNQEVTIQKLRDTIKEMEDRLEEMTAVRVSEKSAELVRTFQEKERELQETTQKAMQRASESDVRLSTMQAALESTQSELFELKSKFDEESSARSAELDILMTDLERANQRAASAEKQIETLSQNTSSQVTSAPDKVSSDNVELELELQARDKEISRLVEDVQRLQSSLSRLKEASAGQVTSLEEQLAGKTSTLRELETRLAAQSDYEEMKRELSVIKMIEFSSSAGQNDLVTEKVTPSKPLEVLLLEKNRSLQNENTSLKVELSELRGHFSSLQTQHTETLGTAQEQRDLIAQLETDLSLVQPYLPTREEGEGQASNPANLLSEALKDVQARGGVERSISVGGSSVGGSGMDSLLPIVSSQRERFKQRNVELEAECRQQKQTLGVLQREIDSLRGDNVKLYEKIRFLQSYPGTRKTVDSVEAMSKYSSQYEAGLDPFAAFGAKEKQRRYTQLSGPDKATLVLGRFILSNKTARMIAFVYAIVLHLLVFVVVAKLAYTQTAEGGTYLQCSKLFSEHMQMFHPDHNHEILENIGLGHGPPGG
ncbi:protein CASP-like [Halichondria panicea]|uniref:protein CASP-like n=1 Tax=Halichondria panicea TaxID=6063 RepID=UPI00312B87F3